VTQLLLSLAPAAPTLTRGQRLDLIRKAHRRWLAREHAAERIVRLVAPHLRDESATEVPTLDLLDEIAPTTVRLLGVA
jgi:hypothetical protein